jgi:hypothetical protein
MTIQEIINKIEELKLAGLSSREILIETKALYPNFPEIKLKVLIGGTV